MSLFVAVDPSPAALASLAAVVSSLRERPAGLRWVPPQRWHLTVAFYGEVVDRRLGELTEWLGRAADRSPAGTVELAGAGTFPPTAGRARVLWAGLAGDLPALTRLAAAAAAAGRRTGIAVADRPWRPHLTLARAGAAPVDCGDLVGALAGYRGPPWAAPELRLVRSSLGPPSRYETLARWPLHPT